MKFLIVGSGGREHALAWKIAQSPQVETVFVAPGNPMIAREDKCQCISAKGFHELCQFAKDQDVDLTIVGPEDPLAEGIADVFRQENLPIFGPGKFQAQLEGSKEFAKEFMARHGVATANYESFDDFYQALAHVKERSLPLVVKASGLCAGKGVVICQTRQEAEEALSELMAKKKFNEAGSTVVIEDYLEGREVSILALYDGKVIIPMVSSMDHKTIGEGNQGPNTGGMGTLAPAPYYSKEAMASFEQDILIPTQRGLQKEGMTDPACIFFGLMIVQGKAKLLEYNLRFGDPETQVVLSLLKSDLADHFKAACEGQLKPADLLFKEESALCWIGAAKGYPGPYQKGILLNFPENPRIKIFGAGVKEEAGQLKSSGGRIFGAVATGAPLEIRSLLKEYMTTFPEEIIHRKDIGYALDEGAGGN